VARRGLLDWLTGRREPVAAVPGVRRPPTREELLASVDAVEELVGGGAVPAAVASRVARVTATVRQVVPRLDRLGPGSLDAYSVVATATDYLPEAVGGYLRLPRDWANSRPVDEGRTSLMVLIDQLDLLARTMEQVADAVNRRDAEALVAHGRFLADRFGHGSGALTPPTPPPGGPAGLVPPPGVQR
jgi:hypothetical protein